MSFVLIDSFWAPAEGVKTTVLLRAEEVCFKPLSVGTRERPLFFRLRHSAPSPQKEMSNKEIASPPVGFFNGEANGWPALAVQSALRGSEHTARLDLVLFLAVASPFYPGNVISFFAPPNRPPFSKNRQCGPSPIRPACF